MLRGSRGLTAIHGSTSAPGDTVLEGVPPAVQPGKGVAPETATGAPPPESLAALAAVAGPAAPPRASTPAATVAMVISLRRFRIVATSPPFRPHRLRRPV